MAGNTNIKYTTDNTPYFFDADRFEREYFVAKKVYLGKDATRYDSTGPFYYMFAKNKDKFVIAPNFNDAMDNAIVVLNSFELEQKMLAECKAAVESFSSKINNFPTDSYEYHYYSQAIKEYKADIYAIMFAMGEARLNQERFIKKYKTPINYASLELIKNHLNKEDSKKVKANKKTQKSKKVQSSQQTKF